MRSSKSCSRSKSNRNRNQNSGGNVVNRVFDSSGPEGKVRGTPQQIIDKYSQLARDAHLNGDRVYAENFQQHAEHYLRLLADATREAEARREEQDRQNRERQAERDRERAERQEREPAQKPRQGQQSAHQNGKGHGADAEAVPAAETTPSSEMMPPMPSGSAQPDVVEMGGDSGLVETPESKPVRTRAPRKPRAKPDAPKVESGPEVAE